jgi:EmrB/QacA subfamily drug resistance transporter
VRELRTTNGGEIAPRPRICHSSGMSIASPPSPDTQPIAPDPRRWIGLFAALAAPFLGVLDFFIVNLALPQIHDRLGASFSEQELVIALYGLSYAVFVVTGGRLGDTHGRKRMFFIGLSGFIFASLLCGIAPSPLFLLGARFVQGFGASLAFPQVLALVQVNFPEHERPKALAYFGFAVGLASILGQVLGGVLIGLDLFGWGWRTLFLINLPVGGTALWIASRTLREVRSSHPPTLDMSGVLLATIALALFLIPLVEGYERGWPPWSLVMLALFLPALALFLLHEKSASRRGRDPLVDPMLFKLETFRRGLAMIGSYFIGGGAMFFVLSTYEQKGLGKDALSAALTFTGFAVALLASSITASRFVVWHPRKFLFGGLASLCIGLSIIVSGLASTSDGDARQAITCGLALYGLGQGCVSPVMYSTVLSGVPLRSAGAASGVLATCQQIAAVVGLPVIGLVFMSALSGESGALPYAHAAAWALSVNLASMVLATVLALRLPRASAIQATPVEA